MIPRILLVEDNLHNTRLIEQLIEDVNSDIELVKANSGTAAFQAAKDMEFVLVLMDISLPDMDGITITKELKKQQKFRDVPFIAVTAYAMASEEEAFRETFNDYISKPIDDDVFIEKLKKWMGEKV